MGRLLTIGVCSLHLGALSFRLSERRLRLEALVGAEDGQEVLEVLVLRLLRERLVVYPPSRKTRFLRLVVRLVQGDEGGGRGRGRGLG